MSRLPALLRLHEDDPKDADLHFMIAQEYFNAQGYEEALSWLEDYVELGDDVAAGYGLAAECHERLDDVDSAIEMLRRGRDEALACGHRTLATELADRIEELGGDAGEEE